MLFHRYRPSSLRTENRKQKGHSHPSFFVYPIMGTIIFVELIIYYLAQKIQRI